MMFVEKSKEHGGVWLSCGKEWLNVFGEKVYARRVPSYTEEAWLQTR